MSPPVAGTTTSDAAPASRPSTWTAVVIHWRHYELPGKDVRIA